MWKSVLPGRTKTNGYTRLVLCDIRPSVPGGHNFDPVQVKPLCIRRNQTSLEQQIERVIFITSQMSTQNITRGSVCSLAACHLHWPLASRRCLKRSSAEKPLIPSLATFFMTGPGHGRPEHWIFSCAT